MGIEFEIHKKMPIGSGIGSSAASAAAGAFAVNELLGSPFSKKELLPFAVKEEQSADGAFHADNVAPSLLGRSEEHTSELQSRGHLVCRLLLEKKKRHNDHRVV